MSMDKGDPAAQLQRLLEVMRRLRDPAGGCAWDQRQDAKSLARYTLEEAYELVDTIEQGDAHALEDELGDLLFQVVFHARLLEEQQVADFASVAAGIADKLERRHPHVFQAGAAGEAPDWEMLKADERRAKGSRGLLDDIPAALPALGRATKIGRRAAQSGFDWPDAEGARAKILEELAEIDAARATADPALLQEEVGDLLMAVTSLARHLQVDPETALRQANRKFESRFARMETLARDRGLEFAQMTPQQQDELWRQAKRDVQS